jgi:carbohydrate kinase (thermoresistant glucokinase family)
MIGAIIVMGVSGSGKSTIAALLAQQLGWRYEDGDWFHPPANVAKMAAGKPLDDADREPWLHAIAGWIASRRQEGQGVVVACSALKRRYRDILLQGQAEAVRIVFLNGSRAQIEQRMAIRQGHFMPTSLLGSQLDTLEPPQGDENALIVSNDASPHDVVSGIIQALGLLPAPSQED